MGSLGGRLLARLDKIDSINFGRTRVRRYAAQIYGRQVGVRRRAVG